MLNYILYELNMLKLLYPQVPIQISVFEFQPFRFFWFLGGNRFLKFPIQIFVFEFQPIFSGYQPPASFSSSSGISILNCVPLGIPTPFIYNVKYYSPTLTQLAHDLSPTHVRLGLLSKL